MHLDPFTTGMTIGMSLTLLITVITGVHMTSPKTIEKKYKKSQEVK